MKTLGTDIQRALSSWGLIVGIAGIVVAAFFGVFDQMLLVFQGQLIDGLQDGYTVELIFAALSSDTVLLVLPILCAIPFTSAFLDDYSSRFIRSYLPRSGQKEYVRSKVAVTAISGGLVLFLGVMLTAGIFAIIFLPMEVPTETPEMMENSMQIVEIENEGKIFAQQNFSQLMQYAFLFFLSGCLWSLVGGLLATITMSKYMAYASPFILYYVLVILSERYLQDIYVINPQEWINPQNEWVGGMWGIALLIGELIVLTGFLYAKIINRRISDA